MTIENEKQAPVKSDNLQPRVLCNDGNCIGVIGKNGHCRVCGKPLIPETLEAKFLTELNSHDQRNKYFVQHKVTDIKCKTCGFIAYGDDPAIAEKSKCLGCGNIMGQEPNIRIECGNCGQNFSKNANKCPKCGWKPTIIDQVCSDTIQYDNIGCKGDGGMRCPKCGHERQAADNAPDGECPSCGIIYAQYKPPNQLTIPHDNPSDILEKRYKAILGEINQEYYLTKFKQFDQQGTGLKRSWNWPAFFFHVNWFLYRKMYGLFFIFFFSVSIIFAPIDMLARIAIEKSLWGGILKLPILLIPQLFYGIFGNSLYHKHIKKKIAAAQLTIKDEARLLEHIGRGVNKWVIWVGWTIIILAVIGILAAIIIPQFSTNSSKQTENQQSSSSVSAKGEYDDVFGIESSQSSYNRGKFHTKSCSFVGLMKPEYLIRFQTAEQAIKAGFIPCKVCKPNSHDQFDKKLATEQIVSAQGSSASAGLFDETQRQPAAAPEPVNPKKNSVYLDDLFEGAKNPNATDEIAAEPKYTSTEWLNKAIELQGKNDLSGLLNHVLRWTQVLPEDASAWYSLGTVYEETGQPAKAIEAYQQAIRINPKYADAWYNLGNSYWNSNQPAKAIEAYQQAIRINPEYAEAWHNLGSAYGTSNQPARAIEAFQQAIRINPEYAGAWSDLGVSYKVTGQTSQVMEVYKRLKTFNPAKADEFFNKVVLP